MNRSRYALTVAILPCTLGPGVALGAALASADAQDPALMRFGGT